MTPRVALNQRLQRIGRAQQRLDIATLDLLEAADDVHLAGTRTEEGYVVPAQAMERLSAAATARGRAWCALGRAEKGATPLERELARFAMAEGRLRDAIMLDVAVQKGNARRKAQRAKPRKKKEGT